MIVRIMIASMALVALVMGQQINAQMQDMVDNCRISVMRVSNDLVDTNMKLVQDLQKKAQNSLESSYQLDKLNKNINGIREELNALSANAGDMNPDRISRAVRNIATHQAEIFSMFMSPSFALQMYDTWLWYVTESTRRNAALMGQLPSSCTPN
ncbi:hypothetical protein GZH46_01570 [Fragariocoptes setiger]|uniref:Uncharacterized protein n=1 Tax=Fragariocoptes setiger TaxID=1670756 RepID=A0ABQ7S9K1_9ACAR|nr:hypothetical protein GZH46_01570 [Fragariocoptes setiger]